MFVSMQVQYVRQIQNNGPFSKLSCKKQNQQVGPTDARKHTKKWAAPCPVHSARGKQNKTKQKQIAVGIIIQTTVIQETHERFVWQPPCPLAAAVPTGEALQLTGAGATINNSMGVPAQR